MQVEAQEMGPGDDSSVEAQVCAAVVDVEAREPGPEDGDAVWVAAVPYEQTPEDGVEVWVAAMPLMQASAAASAP